MLKKTVLFGSLLAALGTTSTTLAHSSFYKSGFLAGAQVGVGLGSGRFNSTYNINPAAAVSTSNATGTARKTGAIIGLLAGYRHILHKDFTLGLILEANFFANNEINKSLAHFTNPPPAINVSNRLKKTYSIVPTIALGKIFCGRWHASLGLGLSFARFKQQFNVLPGTPISATGNNSTTKVGVVPSVGIEYAATPNVSFLGNVSYEIYSKVSKTFNNNNLGPAPASYTTSIKPKYLAFRLGAVYRF